MRLINGLKKYSLWVTLILLMLALGGCAASAAQKSQPAGYPIASEVFTTRQKIVIPDLSPWALTTIYPFEVAKYPQNGYGTWHTAPGLASEKRLDLMPSTYKSAPVTNAARLLNFFTITDVHIADEESPAQAIERGYKGGSSSGYSPVMLLTTQVLDAAVQTINAVNQQNPFDFGLALGDAINNTQYNELRWYIDILDGKAINPDSGVKDDPVPGPGNDYQDEFKAAGLDPAIPWYQTLGNHDHYWIGVSPVNQKLRQAYLGVDILNLGDLLNDPLGADSTGSYMGAIDGRTPLGDIIGAGPVGSFTSPPTIPAADPDRRSLSTKEWMGEFFKTSSTPAGHGFTQANLDSNFASYSFEPKPGLPIKVIVLDDTQADVNYDLKGYGYLDQARFDWLTRELDQGQAEGKLMIISAHIPIELISWPPTTNSYINPKDLLAKLHTYPNLVLWVSGHVHRNQVTPQPSPDPAHPELGFWEVETASLRDFPQQFRTFEIVRNSDQTLSIFVTDIDPAVKDGSLAALSRSYAASAQQIFASQKFLLPSGVYNAELVKPLAPDMQARIQNSGTPLIR